MNKDALSKKESKFIIFDDEGILQYPDIDEKYVKDIEDNKEQIKEELIDKNIVIIRDHIIKIEQLDLDFKNYFFVNFYNMESDNFSDLITLAYKDKISGLYNRNLWIKICEDTICPINADNYSMIIIKIDLNINDDDIKMISKAIKDNISYMDIAIRNGNEFIIILPNKNEDNSTEILHKIKKSINLNIKYRIRDIKNKNKFRHIYKEIIKDIDDKKNKGKYEDFKFIKEHLINISKVVEKNIEDNNIRENIRNQLIEITNL
ncbi:MAG: GGDEF domain-containing protein, partial [Senegalia sp. (in: firmicutes)]